MDQNQKDILMSLVTEYGNACENVGKINTLKGVGTDNWFKSNMKELGLEVARCRKQIEEFLERV